MEQITVTLDRAKLEQLPATLVADLLIQATTTAEPLVMEAEPKEVDLFNAPTVPVRRRMWTAEDDAKLLHLHENGWKTHLLALHFSRQPESILARLDVLKRGQVCHKKRLWTKKDESDLIYAWQQGRRSLNEISKQLNRTEKAVLVRVTLLKKAGRL